MAYSGAEGDAVLTYIENVGKQIDLLKRQIDEFGTEIEKLKFAVCGLTNLVNQLDNRTILLQRIG